MRIIESGRTDAHDHIRAAMVRLGGNNQAAVCAYDRGAACVVDRITEVIRARIRLCQGSSRAVQFALNRIRKHVGLCG